MEIGLFGGFGEKGRTSVAVKSNGTQVLLDAGIKVGATGADYYPQFLWPMAEIEAVLFTHAHEDHIGGLARLLAQGFRGRILMTAETRDEAPATLAGYAEQADLNAGLFPLERIELFEPGETLKIGRLTIETGRSGHVVGGVWFAVDDGSRRFVYCGDVVPDSRVFVMDPPPRCDVIALDASYGADPISGTARADEIASWVRQHANGCLLPTPLSGRSIELIAAMPGQFAIHRDMRAALAMQIEAAGALRQGMPADLRTRLGTATDWKDGDMLPNCPLLADDGMGKAGPSARLIPMADQAAMPILLTGHLPAGSPGQILFEAGRADWIRMPTHPTLPGNAGIWEAAGRPLALGHSCGPSGLEDLSIHIPGLSSAWRTGQILRAPG